VSLPIGPPSSNNSCKIAQYGAGSGAESFKVPGRLCEAVMREQEATLKLLGKTLKLAQEIREFWMSRF
jgi:hypothetical protein